MSEEARQEARDMVIMAGTYISIWELASAPTEIKRKLLDFSSWVAFAALYLSERR